jgi:hypothetical protein
MSIRFRSQSIADIVRLDDRVHESYDCLSIRIVPDISWYGTPRWIKFRGEQCVDRLED